MKKFTDIFDFVTSQEKAMLMPIDVEEGYSWSFREHVKTTILYKNSQLESGKNKGAANEKPVKNIVLPILRLQYRTEGFDVKDIELFVDDAKNYYKSFLIKKYHVRWARENKIDTFIDDLVESYVDFGGALVKKTSNAVPEVIRFKSIAFCDQTDLLDGPIGIKHSFSPHRLKEMEEVGWGSKSNGATITIDELIALSEDRKEPVNKNGTKTNQTPGTYIEIYEIHGSLPNSFLDPEESDNEYSLQTHVVGFYADSESQKQGVTLFSKKIQELPFKLIVRDGIFGRALGMGGAEELFEPQIWINLDVIRKKEMLDAAAKIVFKTTDDNFANRNKMDDIDNNEILTVAEGKDIAQLDTTPRNLVAFQNNIQEWEFHAQQLGAAQDPIQGEAPKSGVPFRAQALSIQQSQGIHEYRRGKLATFVDEIYQDWIIPHIVREIAKGQEFLAELDYAELEEVIDRIVENQVNDFLKNVILNGELVEPNAVETFKTRVREDFMKGGTKRFIKILEGEFKDAPVSVRISIAGKQEDLAERTDKIVNVVRQVLATPQLLQIPGMKELFESILESSALSPIMFGPLTRVRNQLSQPVPNAPPGISPAPQRPSEQPTLATQ